MVTVKHNVLLWEEGAHKRSRKAEQVAANNQTTKMLNIFKEESKFKFQAESETSSSESNQSDFVMGVDEQSDSDVTPRVSEDSADDGPAHPPLPPAPSGGWLSIAPVDLTQPVVVQRQQAMQLVRAYLQRVVMDPSFALSTPKVRVEEALHRIRRDGYRFWGSDSLDCYTNRNPEH